MKKISAKAKLTIWTTSLVVWMSCIILLLILYIGDSIVLGNSKQNLSTIVYENASEIDFDEGQLEYEEVEFITNNVYTILYSESGEFISGTFPDNFTDTLSSDINFSDNTIIEHTVEDNTYYVFDTMIQLENSAESIWIRGIVSVDDLQNVTNIIFLLALFSLPFFIIIATIGCYIIAKNTFRPIDKIVKTAEEITASEDLSLRINLKKSSPEIQKLSDTFDKMFDQIQGAYNSLESSFKAEKQFTSNVSHELRTPTAVILAQCEYALGNSSTPDDKEEALETVRRQATKMSRLISDLLNIIRLERGVEKENFSKINLSDIVNIIYEEQKLIAPANITLISDIDPNITGIFDEIMVTRLINNLLSNAFRFSKEKGVVLIRLSEESGKIILSVKDDGIGISQEDLPKIWQKFYQIDASRTATENGSMGLGLSMVHQIANLHNATVTVESRLEHGSTFTVVFKNNLMS